ncbi:MAG: CoA transferase [Rhodoglobus sp.]
MSILDAAWHALGEDPAVLALVSPHGDQVPLDSALPVGQLVHDAVAASSLSAGLLVARRSDAAVPAVSLDPVRVATAVTSERHFRLRGEPMNAWAELSGFWPTADGWVRTHANYPHHRARLIEALDLTDAADTAALRATLLGRSAADVEEAVTAAGGIATVVRSEAQWREHPQSAAVDAEPLIRVVRAGEGAHAPRGRVEWDAPAAGIRVLDLTRVISGPVASRTLALWGADVLRVDPPELPELEWQHLDTGAGKRSTILSVDDPRFGELLDAADVVITGYRPGALDRHGLGVEDLVARRPGLVVARLSAWDGTGPLAERRGFDSIVQAATGIAWLESTDGERPGALPAQALDHSAGYLLAAGITSALRRRIDEGGSWLVETSLARVAHELLAQPRGDRHEHPTW